MDIIHIPLLSDNYAYLLIDKASNVAAVIDPAEPQKVLDAAKAAGAPKLTHVLCTHNHWDHAGGNRSLKSSFGARPCLDSPRAAPGWPGTA